jgi:2-iminoacetate synthase
MHAEHLEAAFGVGPHAISVPRIKNADDINAESFDNGIDDDTFAKIVACIRIATPYTGMIVSTRESKECRERLLELGISQMSGGSKTSVGGYFNPMPEDENSAQFDISDKRPLDEVIKWLMELGYLPSFCTAYYRAGRTGERFMEVCKQQQIHNFCHPNAIITLKEYLEDYANAETKALGEKLIKHEMETLESSENIKNIVAENREPHRHDPVCRADVFPTRLSVIETSYRATDPNARYQIAGVVDTLVVGVLASPAFLFSIIHDKGGQQVMPYHSTRNFYNN